LQRLPQSQKSGRVLGYITAAVSSFSAADILFFPPEGAEIFIISLATRKLQLNVTRQGMRVKPGNRGRFPSGCGSNEWRISPG